MELRAAAIFWLCTAFELIGFLVRESVCYLPEGKTTVWRVWRGVAFVELLEAVFEFTVIFYNAH